MATYWEISCSFGLRYFSWYKYLIVILVFSHLGFVSGNLFLIAPFPDLCLLVHSCTYDTIYGHSDNETAQLYISVQTMAYLIFCLCNIFLFQSFEWLAALLKISEILLVILSIIS